MSAAYSPPIPSLLLLISFYIIKCQIYQIIMVLSKNVFLQLTKMKKQEMSLKKDGVGLKKGKILHKAKYLYINLTQMTENLE